MPQEEYGQLASEVSTPTSDLDGTRHSKDSDWSTFTVPKGYVINKEKTEVQVISARGSEHSYVLEYDDEVELLPDTDIWWPRTIRVMTHARSSKGPKGGGGGMKVVVHYTYVKIPA